MKKTFAGILLFWGTLLFASAQELIPWCYPDTITKVATNGIGGIYLYTFDDRGNALVTEYLNRNKEGLYTPEQKITAVFNRYDKVDTTISYSWRNGAYVQAERKISAYDNRANHIYLLNEDYQNNGWVARNRYHYTYNEQNLKTATLVETPVAGTDKWANAQKADYTYDSKGRETNYNEYTWTGVTWAPVRSTTNVYENDRLVQESGKGLNADGVFEDAYRITYTYNTQGLESEWLYEVYEESAWVNAYRRTFAYDENGYQVEYISYEWQTSRNDWAATVRETYTNKENGLRLKVEHYTKVAEATEWVLVITMEYEYNAAGRRTAYNYTDKQEGGGEFRYEFTLNESNDDVRAACFVKQNGEWVPTNRYNLEVQYHDGTEILYANSPAMHEINVHYASGTKTPVSVANNCADVLPDFKVRVYPNPAQLDLHVEMEQDGLYEVSLFDLQGRCVAVRHAVQRATFNVERLHGMYLLRVEKDGAALVRKVIVL